MKKKIMAALLAGVMLLQQPVSGWCAQNTELTQKSEARQESESSEDTADGSEEDTETTGTAAADDGENSQEEDSEDVPTLQAETDEVTLDTGTSDNAPEGQRKILDHIYAESVDLSGMTQEEAQEALQTRVDEITGYQIVLHMDDMSTGVTAKELGVTGDNDGTIRQAMDVGQVGNVIKRYKVKKALEQENLQLDLSYQVDEESVRKALETYCVALNREVVNYELTRENGEFKITNGARGVTLNEDGSVDKVTDYLEHVWKDGPGSVDLDVEITEPKGSQEELAKVKDVLGQGVTDYSASSAARATNVKNGTSKLNGKVLYPGEEISVCDNMVPFTEENGYQLIGINSGPSEIQPQEVGSLAVNDVHSRHVVLHIFLYVGDILPDIFEHVLIPFIALLIRRLCRHKSQYTQLADSRGIDLMLKFLSQLLIRDKYIRDHHAGQVEGFARRRADHADVLELLLDGRKHRMFTPEHKIVVNLITDHRHAVFYTEISHSGQLFLRKHSS